MENSNPVILEISSDDEASFGDASGGGGGEDHDWLAELLDEVDRGTDDSDDVVLVDEVVVKPKKSRLNSSETVNYNGGYDDDDDECVILDGDPDKLLAVDNGKVDDEGSDDLLVVGEKGQVACRDFPHPRHLCVTFPFASTPHDTHCDRCHCYVCDSLAPCVHWSSSISSTDHCHATDKVEFWRAQRKSMKESDKTQPIPNGFPHASLVPSLPSVPANSLVQNQDFNRVTGRPTTHFGIPNISNQGRSQASRSAFPRYQPHLVPQRLHSSTHNRSDLSRDRRHVVGSRGPQFITPCTAFKTSGPARVDSVNDRRGYGLSKNSYGSQFSNNLPLPRCHASSGEVHKGTSDYANFVPQEPQMSSQTPVNSPVTVAIPTQPQVSSQQCRRNFQKAISSHPQIASQPYVRNYFQNKTIPQCPLVSQPNGGNTFHPVPSQTCVSTPLYRGSTCEHPLPPMSSQHKISQHNMDSTYGRFVSSQPQGYADPTSLPNGQNIFQQQNQMQSGLDSNFADFGISWVPAISGSNQQIPAGSLQLQNPVPGDNSQFQSVTPEDNSYGHVVPEDNFSVIDDINSLFPGITEPDSLDFQFETWMFENQSVPGDLEVSFPPGLNVYSPEPGTIDEGTLFDF